MNEVEQLFKQLQAKTGGNLEWTQLHPQHQHEFINAVNVILQITAQRQV